MTTIYALHVKLDIILNDQPQRTFRDGREAWDFEPEHRLVWVDRDGIDHICEVPPVTLPIGYRPRTLCGLDVTTTRLRLVETDEHPVPSCRACFAANLKRLHSGTREGFLTRRITLASLSASLFVAVLLLAPSLDDLAPGPEPAPQEIAHGPAMDDPDGTLDDFDL